MRKVVCLTAVVLVGGFSLTGGTASAGVVRMVPSCVTSGAATTSAGPLQLQLAWATRSIGMLDYFMTYQYVTYSLNGVSTTTTVGDAAGWGPVIAGTDGSGKKVHLRQYTTPVLTTLASGESADVTFVFGATKKVQDDAKSFQGPGHLFAPVSCHITAT
jgi:hypothetical protein